MPRIMLHFISVSLSLVKMIRAAVVCGEIILICCVSDCLFVLFYLFIYIYISLRGKITGILCEKLFLLWIVL
jgi:hypothetical protein